MVNGGHGGKHDYFIKDNKVICALVDESYGSGSSSTQWCDRTGGIKSTWKDDGTDPEKALVADDFANTCKDGLARYIEILKRLLKEGKITEEDNNVVTVRLESTVNVGFEAKQSTEVRINRALYDQLN